MLKIFRFVAIVIGLGTGWIACAQLPGWYLDQVYTNADGSVQYVVFVSYSSGDQHLAGSLLTSAPIPGYGSGTHTFNFPSDLPGDSTNRRMLVATQRFADLHFVQPDYVVPNGFFHIRAGLVGIDDDCCFDYFAPPTDGVSSLQDPDYLGSFGGTSWATLTADATNFAGQHYVFTAPPPPRSPTSGWNLDQIYSNADASIQFVVLSTTDSGEQLLEGSTLVTTGTKVPRKFTFPKDLPTHIDTANRSFLIATQGFAALHVLDPDYIVPNGFFAVQGGHISVLDKEYDYGALPTDGTHALQLEDAVGGNLPTWTVAPGVAINFAGQQYVVAPSPPAAPPKLVSLSLNPSMIRGGSASTATIMLSAPAPIGGTQVTLTTSNKALVLIPARVVVPAGLTSVTFTVMTKPVHSKTQVKISASYNDLAAGASITLTWH